MIDKNGWATLCEVQVACNLLNLNVDIWLQGRRYNPDLQATETCYIQRKHMSYTPSNTTMKLLLRDGHFTVLYQSVIDDAVRNGTSHTSLTNGTSSSKRKNEWRNI